MRVLFTLLFMLLPAMCWGLPLWLVEEGRLAMDQSLLDRVLAKNVSGFSLPLGGDYLNVTVEEISKPNLGITSLRGNINGNPESFFLLCRAENGSAAAFFQPGDGTAYMLDHTKGYDAVYAVEYGKFVPCTGGLPPQSIRRSGLEHPCKPVSPKPGKDPTRSVADDGSRHDIVVGYTPAAMDYMGGLEWIEIAAQLSVDAANLAYENSNIPSTLRLVHVLETQFVETDIPDYTDHPEALWNPSDGHMDNMLPARDRTGADFFSVLIDGRDSSGEIVLCGVAPTMEADRVNGDFEDLALSVVAVQCAVVDWSFAHEVGHNRGCAHNREDASVYGAYSYSFGRRFEGADDGAFYRTVMAYDHFLEPHARIPYFSNPDVTYAGSPTGRIPGDPYEAHNALTQNNTAALCATFRGERTFVNFGGSGYEPTGLLDAPFLTIQDGVAGARDGGAVVLQTDKTDFSGVLQGAHRLFIHDGSGSVLLGGGVFRTGE